jgi:four helix bundle protein
MQGYHDFTKLSVWKKARILKHSLWKLIRSFPPEEKYRLSDQILRCARSVMANIAEGHGRSTIKDQIHFCIQARGSLSECLNHLVDAFDCRYITLESLLFYKNLLDETGRLLNGYIKHLRAKANAPTIN